MIAPFQYLSSFMDCMLLPPKQVCRHYSTYPTLLKTTSSALHRFFLAPEPLSCTEWAFLTILITCLSIVGYCIYNLRIRGRNKRGRKVGGFWNAVDNLFGYVLGYDTQSNQRTYPYDYEEDEWLERMM